MKYIDFILSIIKERGQFGLAKDIYKERHHIKPRCLGGSNKKDNLIDLTAKEHFEAHKLLALENPDNYKIVLAWQMMAFVKDSNQQRVHEITAEEYSILKHLLAKTLKNRPTTLGHKLSDETKLKISNATKGRVPWNKGLVGRKDSSETRAKKAAASRLLHTNPEYRAKLKAATTGLKRSEDFKYRQHLAALGNTNVKGYKWFNNGIKNIRCLEQNKPDGFIPGKLRLIKKN